MVRWRQERSFARARDDSRFSYEVRSRDGWRCVMERWVDGRWVEHGERQALAAAHIYARANCGRLKSDPIVGITACLDCHDRLDGRTCDGPFVRVPPDREAAAYAAIAPMVKFHLARKRPPERPDE